MTRAAPHTVERVPWAELLPDVLAVWGRPDGKFDPEHMAVYGINGSGKSYFIGRLVEARNIVRESHVVYLATKDTDETISRFGWPTIDRWPPGYGQSIVVYWARAKGLEAVHLKSQRAQVMKMLNAVWTARSPIVVVWDEITYCIESLGMRPVVSRFLREGRSHGITNVCGLQRAAGVNRLIHSECRWNVAFNPKDEDDRRRLAEILGDRAYYMNVLSDLDATTYEFLIIHQRTGAHYISHLPRPSRTPVR